MKKLRSRYKLTPWFSTLLTLFLALSVNAGCHKYICDNSGCHKKPEKKDELLTYLISYLGLLKTPGEYYARLYYLNPLIITDEFNSDFIAEVSADPNPTKKKLVLIHGWDFADRSDPVLPYPSDLELKDRILSQNWSNFISTTEYDNIVLPAGLDYDVYAFDYLSSDGIDINGRRLREKLDTLFSGQTGTVVIYAHSMGGLLSRFAAYEGDSPAYLKKVITTGTPYHGSPWASPEFQADKSSIGVIAAFFTNTQGGQDLRWDNFDSSLPGASNPKLDAINVKVDRDTLFYTFYGSYTGAPTIPVDGRDTTLIAACGVMHVTTPFDPSDCIVPVGSATLSGHTTAGAAALTDHTHIDVKMGTPQARTALYTYLSSLP